MSERPRDAGGSSGAENLQYVMEGSRPELKRFVDALWHAGITAQIRVKDGCAPTS